MFTYLLESSLYWAAALLMYRMLLQKETFFSISRAYLLGTFLLGLILPLFQFESGTLPRFGTVWLQPVTVTIHSMDDAISKSQTIENQWFTVAKAVYFSVAAAMLFRLVYGIFKIFRLVQSSEKIRRAGYIEVKTDTMHTPFSFFNYLFWSKNLNFEATEAAQILRHELTHIRQHHTFDVLLLELAKVVFWWHPLVWFYKNSLMEVHEFLADEAALQQSNRQQYGHLLIRQTHSGMQPAIANHFIQSQLKKRIQMMTKNASPRWALLKYAAIVPCFLLLFSFDLTSQSNVAKSVAQSPIAFEIVDTITTYDPETSIETVQIVKTPVYKTGVEMPRFPGCENQPKDEREACAQQKLIEFISKNMSYPAEARQKKQQGMVVVKFVVGATNGKIRDAKVEKSVAPALDAEALRIVNAMPDWIPGMKEGKAVSVEFALPFKFKLD